MRRPVVRTTLLVQLLVGLSGLWAPGAPAQPGYGPREIVDQPFTTTRPSSPTGMGYTGIYHAAGNRRGNPPFLRRMAFYPPRGMRLDTSVPARCSASDVELQLRGPDACPAGSRLGGGKVAGLFFMPLAHSIVFDHYHHTMDIMNAANEQIILVKSEGFTVVRGRIRSDGAIDFNLPTCFPAPPTGGCVDDYIMQLRSSTFLPRYTRTSRGRVRGYATTPAMCPAAGLWRATVRFWWANGAVDNVVTKEPCRPPRSHRLS
jgi:hypothetical protein